MRKLAVVGAWLAEVAVLSQPSPWAAAAKGEFRAGIAGRNITELDRSEFSKERRLVPDFLQGIFRPLAKSDSEADTGPNCAIR